ncbi:uncharacterized protein I303_108321 [Kwoniella dejecticola CBS 10117]|uniref:Uncharacterized protein n=1 Tax=Kwoniella dejecticola CBS 10117 TaxID=1296121 RepID=A0A1A5ZXR0_9TREE|nr:uncharacterized protein I303_07352 [Kwoniella dejecticola CBS 10117]OBR82590.1 hypothetical protein I303_07352 [Kwoniella dejecticola CBS 10117]
MPYIDQRYAQQIVPYDANHHGLYLAPGQGRNVPEKVIVCYRPNEYQSIADSWCTASSDYTQRRRSAAPTRTRRRYESDSTDESWVLGSSYSSDSSVTSRDLPLAYHFYDLLRNMKNKLYLNMYHETSPAPRRRRYFRDACSSETRSTSEWDITSSEYSDRSSDYWDRSSSEEAYPSRYGYGTNYQYQYRYPERRRSRRMQRGRRDPGFLERFFGW